MYVLRTIMLSLLSLQCVIVATEPSKIF